MSDPIFSDCIPLVRDDASIINNFASLNEQISKCFRFSCRSCLVTSNEIHQIMINREKCFKCLLFWLFRSHWAYKSLVDVFEYQKLTFFIFLSNNIAYKIRYVTMMELYRKKMIYIIIPCQMKKIDSTKKNLFIVIQYPNSDAEEYWCVQVHCCFRLSN